MSGIQRYSTIALAAAARVSASGNTTGVDVSRFAGLAKIALNSSATEGAGQTSDVKLQHSADNVTFTDAGVAFTQVTNAASSLQEVHFNVDRLKKYVRVVTTLGGASPFVTRGVTLTGKLAY